MSINSKDNIEKAFNYFLILLPASLFYDKKITSILIVVVMLLWFLRRGYADLKNAFKDSQVLVFVALFVVPAVSLLYSTNKDISLLEKRIPLLLFPIVFYSFGTTSRTIRMILYGFIASCLLASTYTFIYTYYTGGTFDTAMTDKALGIMHVYFGPLMSLAIIILVHSFFAEKISSGRKFLLVSIIAFLLGFMFLVGGKMSIISLFTLAVLVSVVFVIRTKRWSSGVFLILLSLAIFYFTLNSLENVKSRFSYIFNEEHYFIGDNAWTSIGVRLTVYKCSWEVFSNPVFGTGIGDVQNDLDKCYGAYGFNTVKSMNTHNQYLQHLLGVGLVGLFGLLLALVFAIRRAIKKKNVLYLCFIFVFAFCCLTESLLERQLGVIYFAFFNSLFYFQK